VLWSYVLHLVLMLCKIIWEPQTREVVSNVCTSGGFGNCEMYHVPSKNNIIVNIFQIFVSDSNKNISV
jgi:hypothetical protein